MQPNLAGGDVSDSLLLGAKSEDSARFGSKQRGSKSEPEVDDR
jgi:hypothetical protein